MKLRISIGRILGIRVWLHVSRFLVLGLVLWVTVAEYRDLYPHLAPGVHVAMGLVTGLVFFSCLVAHELAHAVVARRFGVTVGGITLFMFGGVAEIDGEIASPSREFAVALAGPASSIGMGGVFALLARAAEKVQWRPAIGVLVTLSLVNLGVALFNLIPGLPLDGGRMLRAGLWRVMGDHRRATRVAAAGGRLLAAGLAVFGLVVAFSGDLVGLWYLPMAVFLWTLARGAGRVRLPVRGQRGALAWEPREGHATQPGS